MNDSAPPDGVLLLNFGEPANADEAVVTAYLERIFFANAGIEDPASEESARRRSVELAERRAPALLGEYRRIGGSPLDEQARAQAAALSDEMTARGRPIIARCGMQYTDPLIGDAVRTLVADGARRIVLLPIFPLCGPSTTVAALAEARAAIGQHPDVAVSEVSGWHRHPRYIELRARAIRAAARAAGVDPIDEGTELVFSAHGTPMKYVRSGSRYVRYVEDWCAAVASAVGAGTYTLGYQNHANRGVEWTQPDVEVAVRGLGDRRECVLVDAVSFMHEQSETLAELDLELREEAEQAGLRFVRVPIPHADPDFARVLADLVQAAWGEPPADLPALRKCVCRPAADVCLNGETD